MWLVQELLLPLFVLLVHNSFLFPEYNVLQPSPLNEKVLKEKRKKLRETFDRVLKMYVSIDHEN